jgi:hypothetical protein
LDPKTDGGSVVLLYTALVAARETGLTSGEVRRSGDENGFASENNVGFAVVRVNTEYRIGILRVFKELEKGFGG